jgi:hypothetical protein
MVIMKNLKFIALIFLIVSLLSCSNEEHKKNDTIHINDQSDFDKYKNLEFASGTTILFASGKSFSGQFAPTGSGTKGNPIKITTYDAESGTIYWDDIDNKPIINGHGEVNSTLYLYNGQFWEINNLELTNTDGTDEDQGDLRGTS